MLLAVSSPAPGDPPLLRTNSRGSVLPVASEYTIGSLIHIVTIKLVTLPNASAASPRSAAELAAALALADCVAFPVSPLVRVNAPTPATVPFTPALVGPAKFADAPDPLYEVNVTLT